MIAKRAFDVVVGGLGLVLLSPLLAGLAVWIKLDSPGPVFFRQLRVGRHGRPFRIHKFRTMVPEAERQGLQLTVGADRRITRAGAVLRHYKLDELPQLLDVVAGTMSLVGPRPEVPRYVECYSEDDRRVVLSVRPGITDPASIDFRDENAMLAGVTDPDAYYVDRILPVKVEHYRRYVATRSMGLDLRIIIRTICTIAR